MASITTGNSASQGVNLAQNNNVSGALGVINLLTNGTLNTGRVLGSSVNATTHLNFNGGTLKVTGTNAGTIFGDATLDAVNVYSGGGTINNNNTAITINRGLLAPTGFGVSSSTIAVPSGGSGYIGAPLVKLTGGTGTGATGYAVMTGGAVTSIVITSPGIGYTTGNTLTATFFGGGAATAATNVTGIAVAANTSGGMTFAGAGTTTLTSVNGANTYTGATTISAGTVQLGDGTTNGSLSASSGVTNNAAIIFNVVGASNHASAISGPGTFSKIGAGALSLSANNSYTGATSVTVGGLTLDHSGSNLGALGNTAVSLSGGLTLLVKGTTNIGSGAGGTLTAGAASVVSLGDGTANTFTLGGGITLSGSILNLELGNSGLTGTADRITANGAATISGSNVINLSLIPSQTVIPGTYTLFSAASGLGSGFTIGTKPTGFYTFDLSGSTATAEILSITGNAAIVGAAYWTGLASTTGAPTDATNSWGYGSALITPKSNWSTTANGLTDPLQVPSSNTDVIFTATNAVPSAGTTLTTQLDGAYGINSLTFDVPAITTITSAEINTNSNALTLGTSGLTLAATSNASATINGSGAVILNGSQSWANNNALGLTVSAGITAFSGVSTLTLNGTGTGGVILGGVIGNGTATSLGLVISQAGITQLNGNNTFTGGVTINSGTVQLGNAGALNSAAPNTLAFGAGSTGKLQLNGNSVTVSRLNTHATVGSPIIESGSATAGTDTLTVNTTNTDSYAGLLQNGGARLFALTKSGVGSLTLANGNTYSGPTNINGGSLVINASSNIGDASATNTLGFNGGTLRSTANTYDLGSTRAVALSGAGTIQVDAGAVTVSGNVTGAGTFTKTGGGTLTLSGTNSYTGVTTVTGGILNLSGSTTSSVIVAPASGVTAIANLSAAMVLANGLLVNAGNTVGGTGILNIGAGASISGGNQDVRVGSGGFGVVNMTAGTVTPGAFFVSGLTATGIGIWNLSGGLIQTVGANAGTLGGNVAGAIGQLNVTGTGTFNSSVANTTSGLFVGENATGVLNVSGGGSLVLGGLLTSNGLRIGHSNVSTAIGIVNLGAVTTGGGTITTNRVSTAGTTATSIFNFHGGTLKASFANTTFMTGLSSANVYGEGGTIDNNGLAITIDQALLAPTGNGVTVISAAAAGLVTTGYTTAPLVIISGGTGTGATAVATIDGSGNLIGITVTNPGVYSVAPTTVTLTGGGYASTSVSTVALTTAANVSGGLAFTGGSTTTVTGASSYSGDTTINSGTLIANRNNNSFNPTTSALGNSQAARNIIVNTGGTLNFAQGDTFGGASSAVVSTLVINAGGLVTNTINNFTTLGPVILNGGTLTTVGGAATGYESYSFSGNVTVGGSTTSTISVTGGGNAFNGFHLGTNTNFNVANAVADLTVSAPLINRNATLGGLGGLTKSGVGTMTLTASNTYTGGTIITGGILALGHATNTLADAGAVTVNGGTLAIGTNNDTVGAVTLTSGSITGSTGVLTGTSYATTNGTISAILGGAGALTQSGSGTTSLTATNTYTGATTINTGGTLALGATGSIASSSIITANGTFDVSAQSGVTIGVAQVLKGSGTVNVGSGGNLAIDGVLAAGNSPGVLTVSDGGAGTSSTSFSSGSIFSWDLDTTLSGRGTAYDGVNTSAVSGSGAVFQVVLQGAQSFGDAFWTSAHTWSDIFTTNGTTPISSDLAAVFSTFTYANGGGVLGTPSAIGSFSLTGSTLSWSAVPEPTTALAGLLLGAGLLRRRRNSVGC